MDFSDAACRRIAQTCGFSVALAGLAALAGWATEQPILRGLRSSYIPMAPNTALAFIALGSSLPLVIAGWRWGRRFAAAGAALVGLIGVLKLTEYATGVESAVDYWFFHVRGAPLGLAPIGRMSLPTAAAFIAASVAVVALAWPGGGSAIALVPGACGLITGMTGLVFGLGYLFSPNAPLLYGSEAIPMALNTALCFLALGVGMVAAAGPAALPLSRLSGPSIRARLLRIFLPLVVGTVGVVAWLTHLVTTTAGSSSAAISSAALAAVAIVLFGLIFERSAGRVGLQLETAEAELQQAHDLLEGKVQERTFELSTANLELARALRGTQLAHDSLQQAHLELKQAQSRMLQQARMASLGQTAAGVAHEINNPLAFVTNDFSLLKREIIGLHDLLLLYQQAERTLAEYERDLHARITNLAQEVDLPFVLANLESLLDRSRSGLLRIQKIVADLRDFARLEEADYKEADLNAGIAATVRLMQSIAAMRQVTLETDLAPLPEIACYPGKMNLVFQSLISNAIDASPPGSRVLIETRSAGGGIQIRVADNGCGIPPSIRDRIFDPFFTTKPVGKGTGLGLSISYGIVRDHGGVIDFESVPGAGTCFTINLPVGKPGAPPAASSETARQAVSTE